MLVSHNAMPLRPRPRSRAPASLPVPPVHFCPSPYLRHAHDPHRIDCSF